MLEFRANWGPFRQTRAKHADTRGAGLANTVTRALLLPGKRRSSEIAAGGGRGTVLCRSGGSGRHRARLARHARRGPAAGRLEQLGNKTARAFGAIAFDLVGFAGAVQRVCDRGSDGLGCRVGVVRRSSGVVALGSMADVEVLLEIPGK